MRNRGCTRSLASSKRLSKPERSSRPKSALKTPQSRSPRPHPRADPRLHRFPKDEQTRPPGCARCPADEPGTGRGITGLPSSANKSQTPDPQPARSRAWLSRCSPSCTVSNAAKSCGRSLSEETNAELDVTTAPATAACARVAPRSLAPQRTFPVDVASFAFTVTVVS